ncbi:MAG: hypothetical protein WC953_03515 [Pseudomonas sp.]
MITETQFNRPTLDCMITLRRHLKRSIGVTVHLGEPDALAQMIKLSEASADVQVRQLGSELALIVAKQQKTVVAEKGLFETMRERLLSTPNTDDAEPQARPASGVQIYRGQIVRR